MRTCGLPCFVLFVKTEQEKEIFIKYGKVVTAVCSHARDISGELTPDKVDNRSELPRCPSQHVLWFPRKEQCGRP